MKNLLFIIASISFSSIMAQTANLNLISAAGEEFSAGNSTLNFTVGDIAIETFSANDLQIAQGFLQPIIKTSVFLQNEFEILVHAYPNPTKADLFVELETPISSACKLSVLDINGKLIFSNEASEQVTQLNTSSLYAGMYILNIQIENVNKNILFNKLKH